MPRHLAAILVILASACGSAVSPANDAGPLPPGTEGCREYFCPNATDVQFISNPDPTDPMAVKCVCDCEGTRTLAFQTDWPPTEMVVQASSQEWDMYAPHCASK